MIVGLLIYLPACGFHLRGQSSLPPEFQSIQLLGENLSAKQRSLLEQKLRQAGASLQAADPAKPQEGFDPRDPAHVGEFVAYLASDAAHWISGQVFSVYGDKMHLTKGWNTVSTIEKPGAGWTADELVAAMPKLAGMAPVSMMEQLLSG